MALVAKILKIAGILLVVLLLTVAALVYTEAYNYTHHSLEIDKARFPGVTTERDVDALAESLLSQMSLDEKIEQLYGEPKTSFFKLAVNWFGFKRFPHIYAGRNERLGIPPFVLTDGPRGARISHQFDGATVFPVAMARGASWDVELESRINDVIAKEAWAIGANMAATPCINLLRHPGWGRAQETYGEDPWHVGQFGVSAVRAIQDHNVMASPKHFALNSIENSRFFINVEVEERALREVYLPQFRKVVQEGGADSMMSAYNSARGEYLSNNKYLLTDILRHEWGFEGFVHSDWIYAMYDTVGSIKAGLNVEMPVSQVYNASDIKDALENGEITEEDIDSLVLTALKVRLRYAFAEDSMEYGPQLVAADEHVQLAREAAEESMVLLKNEGVLPFDSGSGKTIAIIGRLADKVNTGDRGSSNASAPYVITPYQGLANYHSSLGNKVILDDGTDFEQARELAASADQVILVVGYTYENEGEYLISDEGMRASAKAGKRVGEKGVGGDRENLGLVEADQKLIKALAPVNDRLAVVYVGGSAIDMSGWSDSVPAILFAWYSGMEGGNALARVLYGDVNPSGKLPFAMAADSADYPHFTPYAMNIDYGYYHGYTLFDKRGTDVAYPFGFGLSYTSYHYENLRVPSPILGEADSLKVQVDVTNTGALAGEEIVQMYVGFANSAVDRPVKLLRDFDKVALQPGETRTVTLDVPVKELAWYNPDDRKWQTETMSYEVYVGGSSAKEDLLTETFVVQ